MSKTLSATIGWDEERHENPAERLAWAQSILARYGQIKAGVSWTPAGWTGWSLHAEPTFLDKTTVTLSARADNRSEIREIMLFFRVIPRRIRPYASVFFRSLKRMGDTSELFGDLAAQPYPDVPVSVIEQLESFVANPAGMAVGHALSTIAELEIGMEAIKSSC